VGATESPSSTGGKGSLHTHECVCVLINLLLKVAENRSLRSSPCEVISLGAAQFAASLLTAPRANGVLSPQKTRCFRAGVAGRSCNWGV